MNAVQSLMTHWDWTSTAWFALVGALSVDFMINREDFASLRGRALRLFAVSLFLLAYVSPIGVLADGYSFAAHTVQHLLLLLVIPLCYVLSLCDSTSRSSIIQRVGKVLSFAPLSWLSGLGVMWLWHVPNLCHAAAQNAAFGVVRDSSLLLAGIAFWWPIFSPRHADRLAPPLSAAYLFTACLGCTLLGVYITFTPVSVCPAFVYPVDRLGILPLIRGLGLTPTVDQSLGGLLMWVPPCLIYGGALLSVVSTWYAAPATSVIDDSSRLQPVFAPLGGTD